jgi:hypothetical protein
METNSTSHPRTGVQNVSERCQTNTDHFSRITDQLIEPPQAMQKQMRRHVCAYPLLPREKGASLDQYVCIANDILFNPEGTIEHVDQAYEQQLVADGDDGS